MTDSATNRATPEKLDMFKSHKLVTLLLDETDGFTAKQMTFDQYATFACSKLPFPVTKNQVQTRVREFGIPHGAPSKRGPITDDDLQTMASVVLSQGKEIADLQERLTRLEGWVNTTFPSKSPLKVVG